MTLQPPALPIQKQKGDQFMAYDRWYHKSVSALSVELDRFKNHGPLGRFGHLKNVVDHLRCYGLAFEWNEWSELLLKEFCSGERHILVAGASGSSKSTTAALYALVWWLCDLYNSLVAITSTSKPMARKRIWGEIVRLYMSVTFPGGGRLPGNLVNSAAEMEATKGDRIHSIAIVPGSPEKEQEGLGKIKGWHAPRVLVVGDELQDMTQEVINGLTNIMTGANEGQFIGLGNPTSRLDTHGLLCEPVNGWESITVDDEYWETAKGICIHLDGLKSPNIPEKKHKGLIGQSDLDETKEQYGEDSLQWWSMRRGFWPPEGSQTDRVMSEGFLIRCGAYKKAVWKDSYVWIAGLDPAYGGDRCILQFAKYGLTIEDKWTTEFIDPIIVPVKLSSLKPTEEQIAEFSISECKKKNMQPEDLGIDSTGQGKAPLRLMQRDWGNVTAVEFGGAASETPIAANIPKPANKEYANRVTELWFTIRRFAEAGCVRGLAKDTAKELTGRKFTLVGNPKRSLMETKEEYKGRLKMSPDKGDAAAVCTAVARQKGGLKSERPPASDDSWNKAVKKYHRVYSSQYAYT